MNALQIAALVLQLQDPQSTLGELGQESVKREVSKVFGQIGIEIEWVGIEEGKPAPTVSIILAPSMPKGGGWEFNPDAMGATFNQDGNKSQVVYVFSERIRKAMKTGDAPDLAAIRKLRMALAKVIVHEIFHALLPGRDHSDHGVTTAGLSPQDLADPIRWDPAAVEALRGALR